MPRLYGVLAKIARKPGRPEQPELFAGDFAADLLASIDPYVTATRYNRTWRFSRPLEMSGFLTGKLGFVAATSAIQVSYDEERQDFVERSMDTSQGDFVHWIVNLETQHMVFEIRPPRIREQTFLGAFRALLDVHGERALTVEQILEPRVFYDWLSSVDRVVAFRAVMRAPNPDWQSRPDTIIRLIERTNADRATIEVKKENSDGGGLHIRDTILEETVEYGQDGYSEISAEGVKNGQVQTFNSKKHIPMDRVEVDRRASDETIWSLLVRLYDRLRPKK